MPGPAFLNGDRVELRTFEEEDLEFVRDVINDHAVWTSVGGQSVPSNLAQERKFFEDLNRDENAIGFIITVEASRVGGVELNPIDWERGVAEVSCWIAPDHQERGYATETLRVIADYAFDHLRLHKLIAEIFDFNEASANVFETVGFHKEGVLRDEDFVDGEYIDVNRYGLLESDHRDPDE